MKHIFFIIFLLSIFSVLEASEVTPPVGIQYAFVLSNKLPLLQQFIGTVVYSNDENNHPLSEHINCHSALYGDSIIVPLKYLEKATFKDYQNCVLMRNAPRAAIIAYLTKVGAQPTKINYKSASA
jgi:hypothetical protein